ncbi:MAG: TatD family hydrolase [Deltaproteobacteria bacterium]|nr:MAG: TatD family hydrolase [Deltaproteobacteria bacterium]
MLIDTHAHLDMKDFDKDRQATLDRALEGGITHIITIGIDLSSSLKALELAKTYDFVYASVGYHPHNATQIDQQVMGELEKLVSEPKVVAWGEIGLDFYRRYSPPDTQVEAFKRQLGIAMDLDLPVIIHDREAHRELFEILKEMRKAKTNGVIHCFSGNYDMAMALIEMGYYISIPGTVTYKKALQVQEVATGIPLDRLLVETDAPFLAPVPYRGKRNEPLFVTYTAQKIAELRNLSSQEVALKTSENAKRVFDLPDKP